ncbi:MAG: methyltransferase [Vicinamibacteria bacterium]
MTRLLFGVRVPHQTAQGHWDFSTLVLFDELRKRVRPGARVLEIGTGEAGTLSVAMARLVPATYLALDVAEEAVQSAQAVAAANGVTVEFLRSDLFSALPAGRSFDLTFFNPPYVPRAMSRQWKTLGEPARVWDGGEDGLDVIRRFFSEGQGRAERLGTVLVGFNRRAVSADAVARIAGAHGFGEIHRSRAAHPGTVVMFRC